MIIKYIILIPAAVRAIDNFIGLLLQHVHAHIRNVSLGGFE